MAEEIILSDGDDRVNYLEEAISKIVHAGAGNDVVVGTRLSDELLGGAGYDELRGGPGRDIIEGGAGADVMHGNGVNGQTGDGDALSYRYSPDWVYVSLAKGVGRNSDAEGDRFFDFADLFGSRFGDILEGDDNDNLLHGFAGNDSLLGLGGSDYLSGGNGNDRMYGGEGSDTLEGGLGSDELEGGAGDDAFLFRRSHLQSGDRDIIRDLEDGEEIILKDFYNLNIHYQATDDGGVEITFARDLNTFEVDTGYVIEVQNTTIEQVQESIIFA